MRPLVLLSSLSLAFLLAGCADAGTDDLEAEGPAGTAGAAGGAAAGPADAADGVADESAPDVAEVGGTIEFQAGGGSPVGHQATETGVQHEVSFDAAPEAVLLELVWEDGAAVRSPLLLRVIDSGDRYMYANGAAGTPEDPVRLLVENPVAGSWDVAALPDDSVVVQQSYTIRVSAFADGPVPDGYSAFA